MSFLTEPFTYDCMRYALTASILVGILCPIRSPCCTVGEVVPKTPGQRRENII